MSNRNRWLNWVNNTNPLPDFAESQALLNSDDAAPAHAPAPMLTSRVDPSLPAGITIVDEVNGLFTADPVVVGNVDLAGQFFSAEQTSSAFSVGSQAAATIHSNAHQTAIPGTTHVGVWPMVSNGDGSFSVAPETGEGVYRSEPWIQNAWTVNPKADLVQWLRDFRQSTFHPATPGGPMI